ncbi:hypothetical protein CYG49_04060 [Candidatus Saccharibacteria bacterium]|nr:MAG: hypothetical protein CYG49_04060 [Candidatus Saccharibacteria bacterium]
MSHVASGRSGGRLRRAAISLLMLTGLTGLFGSAAIALPTIDTDKGVEDVAAALNLEYVDTDGVDGPDAAAEAHTYRVGRHGTRVSGRHSMNYRSGSRRDPIATGWCTFTYAYQFHYNLSGQSVETRKWLFTTSCQDL